MEKQSFTSLMNQLTHHYGVHQVFSDFLTLVICAFSHGRMEKQYLQTIEKYKKSEAYLFSKALAAMIIEMTGDGSGMVDVLGTYFEQNLSRGQNGHLINPLEVLKNAPTKSWHIFSLQIAIKQWEILKISTKNSLGFPMRNFKNLLK